MISGFLSDFVLVSQDKYAFRMSGCTVTEAAVFDVEFKKCGRSFYRLDRPPEAAVESAAPPPNGMWAPLFRRRSHSCWENTRDSTTAQVAVGAAGSLLHRPHHEGAQSTAPPLCEQSTVGQPFDASGRKRECPRQQSKEKAPHGQTLGQGSGL